MAASPKVSEVIALPSNSAITAMTINKLSLACRDKRSLMSVDEEVLLAQGRAVWLRSHKNMLLLAWAETKFW